MSTTYRWRAQEERLLQTLLPTNSFREISEQINRRHDKGLPGFPCERTADAVRRKCDREGWTAENAQEAKAADGHEDLWGKIQEIEERYRAAHTLKRRGVVGGAKAVRKILSMSDLHFPLTRHDLLKQIVEEHDDADIVVLNGDILEGYVFSSFSKNKSIAALDEYLSAFMFVKMLSEMFPKVVLVGGNHDIRASSALKRVGLDRDATQVLRPDLLARIANGELLDETGLLVKKYDFSNVIYEQRESWFVKIGNTLFIHPHTRGSLNPGHTVTRMGEKLIKRYEDTDEKVDSVVCGHTHQLYWGVRNGRLFIEQGMLSGVLSYLFSPRNDHRFNYQNGYAVIYQDKDGNTDFNLSRPVYLGECLPPKKSAI